MCKLEDSWEMSQVGNCDGFGSSRKMFDNVNIWEIENEVDLKSAQYTSIFESYHIISYHILSHPFSALFRFTQNFSKTYENRRQQKILELFRKWATRCYHNQTGSCNSFWIEYADPNIGNRKIAEYTSNEKIFEPQLPDAMFGK